MSELTFRCAECDSELGVDVFNGTLSVELCMHCTDNAEESMREVAFAAGYDEGYHRGYDEGTAA